jgi:TrmH family RNA methyltransferase
MGDHPRVRQFVNVKRNRGNPPATAVALEGSWALRHALASGVEVESVMACPTLFRGEESARLVAAARARGARVYEISERVLHRIVDRDGPDGIAAVAHLRCWSLADVSVCPATRVVVLDRMELAGNLGAIIRCADGAGAGAVVLTDRRTRVTHPLAVKASMGTVFSLPVIDTSVDSAVEWARTHGVRVVAADPTPRASYRGDHYGGPAMLVLGSERYGLSDEWRAAADILVSIPMRGVADSLNVGHAAALLLYEALTQTR